MLSAERWIASCVVNLRWMSIDVHELCLWDRDVPSVVWSPWHIDEFTSLAGVVWSPGLSRSHTFRGANVCALIFDSLAGLVPRAVRPPGIRFECES